MKVRYIYSACVVIETEDVVLCCDPWFTAGIYDGSWHQYPPLSQDPIEVIGKVDAIYVSHIHPDHYDVRFLRRYLQRYPDAQVIIGETEPPHLLNKMRIDGIKPRVLREERFGNTQLYVIPNRVYDPHEHDNIDTALIVSRGNLSVANLNDNLYDQEQLNAILSVCPLGRPTLALLPYSGAGPYPQTYEFESKEGLQAAAERKKQQFLNLYSRYMEALRPVRAMPFAGQYFLGGPLAELNSLRGVADATEVLNNGHVDRTVILADGGAAFIDLETLKPSAIRSRPYDPKEIQEYLKGLAFGGYDYEREIQPLKEHGLPLAPLMRSAYASAIKNSQVSRPCWLCIKPSGSKAYMALDTFNHSEFQVLGDVSHLQPRFEMFIDGRYLFGLLTRLYHWNNAEIGSQFRVKRVPDEYRLEVHSFLSRLHV